LSDILRWITEPGAVATALKLVNDIYESIRPRMTRIGTGQRERSSEMRSSSAVATAPGSVMQRQV